MITHTKAQRSASISALKIVSGLHLAAGRLVESATPARHSRAPRWQYQTVSEYRIRLDQAEYADDEPFICMSLMAKSDGFPSASGIV
jgi:hypothetical protein